MAAPRLSTPLPPIWTLAHPLWLCAFRPFFALTALSALGLMLPWVLFLTLGWPLPALGGGAGGALAWQAHELLLGMGLAAAIVPAVGAASGGMVQLPGLLAQTWGTGLALMLGIGLLVGLLPALRGMRLNIVDALAGR